MAGFIYNAITERGRILLGEAQTGATFDATRIVMGSGHIPSGSSAATMTAVVTPVIELAINKKKRAGDGTVTFGGAFSNKTITEAFYFREFALFARVQYADGTYSDEVLYSYGNAGGDADFIPAYSTSTIVEKQMDLVIWIGNETQVNLTVASGLYNAHAEKHAADGEDPITPEMIGAVNLTNKSLQFTNYGLLGVNIDEVVNHNYCVGISEEGYGTRPPNTGWVNVVNFACYHFATQIAVSCTLGDEKKRPVKMWMREKYNDVNSDWSEWAEIYNTSDSIRVPDKTKAGSGGKLDADNGVSLVHLEDRNNDNSARNALILTPYSDDVGGSILFARGGDGLASVKYRLYGEHYSPVVTATAELV